MDTKPIENNSSDPQVQSQKQVLVLIPTGLPGMGKSTLFKKITQMLQDKQIPTTVISSDQVRKEMMDKFQEEDPSLTHKQAFDLSTKEFDSRYFENVRKTVENTRSLVEQTHCIILDKNHTPRRIQDTVDFFERLKDKKGYVIKLVIIKPLCGEGFKTKEGQYPFSLNLFLKCVERALGRDQHDTLTGGDVRVATVVFMFINFYRDFVATSSEFLKMGADLMVEIPFTHEDEKTEKELREVIGEIVGNVLRSMKGEEVDEEEMKKFLEKMKSLEIELKNSDEQELQEKTVKGIDKCLELFANRA